MNLIVAVDKNWAIGKDNDLLFKLPGDMKMFKSATAGNVVVCGRKTLESFPGQKPLPYRSTICLCSKEHSREDCFCIHDVDELKKLLNELSKTQNIFIIGGSKVYHELLNCCDEIIVTKVNADGHGTAFFPNLDELATFELKSKTEDILDNGYITNICFYRKRVTDEEY